MFRLFVESYPRIVNADYVRVRQKRGEGSFHVAAELERASQVFLDKRYKAKDLLNLLRARTFPPHPACHFFDQGEKYEVRVEIKKVSK
jgi:methionyl-tRNA formyltransferase